MDTFTALADPTRRSILELLAARGPLPAGEIYHQFPMTPPAISQHLQVLRQARLVNVEKRAQQRLYQLNPETLEEVGGWARQMTRLWNARFDRLAQVLQEATAQEGQEVNEE